jgi:hypothetical protein
MPPVIASRKDRSHGTFGSMDPTNSLKSVTTASAGRTRGFFVPVARVGTF